MRWLDPLDPNFNQQYQLAYSKAKAFQEIIDMLANSENQMARLNLELAGPDKNYATGT